MVNDIKPLVLAFASKCMYILTQWYTLNVFIRRILENMVEMFGLNSISTSTVSTCIVICAIIMISLRKWYLLVA